MDDIFKALADPTRRALLDALRERDGQTLTDLSETTDLTRFGVMKHLGQLEEAGLITTLKKGRFKHHYLNAVPLQEAIDRWIAPYAKTAARGIIDLKTTLEREAAMQDTASEIKPDFVHQTFIRCTQDALWQALTDPTEMSKWHFLSPKITREDEAYTYHQPDGSTMMVCRTLDATPKTRIEATFEPAWEGGGKPSRTVFLIAPEADHCRLTVEHYDLTFPVVQGEGVADGWVRWAAGLKTWLETGEAARFNTRGAV